MTEGTERSDESLSRYPGGADLAASSTIIELFRMLRPRPSDPGPNPGGGIMYTNDQLHVGLTHPPSRSAHDVDCISTRACACHGADYLIGKHNRSHRPVCPYIHLLAEMSTPRAHAAVLILSHTHT